MGSLDEVQMINVEIFQKIKNVQICSVAVNTACNFKSLHGDKFSASRNHDYRNSRADVFCS